MTRGRPVRTSSGILAGLLCAVLLVSVSPACRVSGQPETAARSRDGESRTGTTDSARPAGDMRGNYVVSTGDVVKTILISGELVAEKSRDIFCPRIRSGFSSTVTFMAEEGSSVKEGDRILEFDSSDLVSSRAEAERALDEAKLLIQKSSAELEAQRSDLLNEVAQAEGSLGIARLYAEIPRELLAGNDYERYQVELERSTLALEKARERLQRHDESRPAQLGLVEVQRTQAELELRKIESDLALLEVNAPQNGIIIYGDNWRENRKVQVGDAVYPGMTVMSLPDLSSMQVIGYIYDTELRYVRPGLPCSFGLDAVPGRAWSGEVSSVTSVAGRKGFSSQHKVFKAVIQLGAQDTEVMRPGMTARIEIPLQIASGVLTVPRPYLGVDTGGRYFVVVSEGPEKQSGRSVEIGLHGDFMVEVKSGLSGGEVLVPLDGAGAFSQRELAE